MSEIPGEGYNAKTNLKVEKSITNWWQIRRQAKAQDPYYENIGWHPTMGSPGDEQVHPAHLEIVNKVEWSRAKGYLLSTLLGVAGGIVGYAALFGSYQADKKPTQPYYATGVDHNGDGINIEIAPHMANNVVYPTIEESPVLKMKPVGWRGTRLGIMLSNILKSNN